ncbi:MAG TPA: hypothetical protein VGF13_17075, partial [Verrucomicrobiae bacterium]
MRSLRLAGRGGLTAPPWEWEWVRENFPVPVRKQPSPRRAGDSAPYLAAGNHLGQSLGSDLPKAVSRYPRLVGRGVLTVPPWEWEWVREN